MKRILAAFGGSLAALLLLEVVLQISAVVVWVAHRGDAVVGPGRPGPNTVLCLGDSFTFGMGASSPQKSYPAQLETGLKMRLDDGWNVVNGGWPSRNSKELLEGLDAALSTHNPRFVCLIVGVNDEWSRPERLKLPPDTEFFGVESGEGFRWRIRTLRLFDIVGAGLGGGEVEASENPDAHLEILRSEMAEGDRAGAQRELDWLINAHRDNPTRWVAEALADGLQASGRDTQALEFAGAQLVLYPDSSRLWLIHAVLSARSGDHDAARRSIDSALETALTGGGETAFLWRTRANVYGDSDRRVVADSLIRAYLEERDEIAAIQWFQMHRTRLDEAMLRNRCLELGLGETTSDRILAVYDTAVSDEFNDAAKKTLVHHLRQVVHRCRARGAVPLLGSYPWHGAFGEAEIRSLAAEEGVTWVPVYQWFDSARNADPEVSLFVHDGHCNDAGYGLMAEAFSQAIMQCIVGRDRDLVRGSG